MVHTTDHPPDTNIEKAKGEWTKYVRSRTKNPSLKLNKLQKIIIALVAGKKAVLALMIGHSWMDYTPKNDFEVRQTKMNDIHEHLVTFRMLTTRLNLKNILEIGTRSGESTEVLAECAKELGGKLTSIDIDPCISAKERIKSKNLESNWKFIQNNSLDVDWNEPIDHMFIDGLHTYEQVSKELRKYEPFVTHGGIITLHDIIHDPPVLDAIEEYIKDKPNLHLYKMLNNNGLGVIFKN